jgi:hypothetical protein
MQGYEVQQSTSTYPLAFLMVLATDHITGATGLSPTVAVSKNGGSFAAPSGAVTEIGSGWYKVAGNATDSGTLGPLLLHASAAVADPSDSMFVVVAYNPQDAVRLGLTALPNTACTTNASLLTSGTGTDQVSASAGKLLLQATQTGVTIPTVTTVGTLTTYTGDTPQTGDSYARLGAPSGASIDADILSRLAGSGYTAPPTSAAIVTALWTDLTSSSDFATAGSVGALVKANTAQTGDSYARIGSTGSGLTALAPASTALSTTQWTNTRAGNLDNLDAAVSTRSTYAGGAVASVTGSVGSIAGTPFPTHFSSLAIDASGRIDVGQILGVASAGAAGYVGLDWGQVTNRASANILSNTTISTGQTILTVTGIVQGNVGGVSSAVTVGFNQDKTGYSLASTGLDSISVAAPAGAASTFPGMLVQVWRRFFKATAKSASNLTIKTFADDGTTVVTTQRYTDDGAGTETLSGSS